MGIDQDADHAQRAVELDAAHHTHVTGEIVDLIASLLHGVAGFFFLEFDYVVLRAFMDLIPLIQLLDVGHAHFVPLRAQGARKVSTDEASTSRD